MKVEQERGISVTASVMTFDYGGCTFNLLDTPGHEDFSEDTYRTLTAVDSAVMVIDAAKGIEAQTRKLFEVCRLRDVPIITFINKLDREGRDPFDLMDEIEHDARARRHAGQLADRHGAATSSAATTCCHDRLVLIERARNDVGDEGERVRGPRRSEARRAAARRRGRQRCARRSRWRAACARRSTSTAYREGHLTPVFFGSAINNFGVRELLARRWPSWRRRRARSRPTSARSMPDEDKVTGFVFKIQANMDPKHRDRIAFVRLCSGHFERGMKLLHVRSRQDDGGAQPGALPGPGPRARRRSLRRRHHRASPTTASCGIGDALTEGETLHFTGIPSFAPELLQRVRADDPMRAKHLGRALRAARRGRRGARLQAAASAATGSSAWSARCSSTCSPTASAPNTTSRSNFEGTTPLHRALGRVRRPRAAQEVHQRQRRGTWPTTTTARRCSWRATPGT